MPQIQSCKRDQNPSEKGPCHSSHTRSDSKGSGTDKRAQAFDYGVQRVDPAAATAATTAKPKPACHWNKFGDVQALAAMLTG